MRPTREMRPRTVLQSGLGGVIGGGSGGRPPYDYVVAAVDSDAAVQAIADAVCDGTADETEINAAITASVSADRPYSILLLPGTYTITGAIDFTGVTASGGDWLVFEASGTEIIAGANLTTMVKLDPGAGGQIITCADLRFGALDGADGTFTVSQIVNVARFNDNILRIEDLRNGSGNGITFAQSGVSDYPCGNNKIDIEIIHNLDGSALQATGGTNAYGFTGNTVHIGEIIACANGIILGGSANQNATYNTFITGPIEHVTNSAIYDYCGGNTFIIGNLNSNTTDLGGPTGMTLKSTYRVHVDPGAAGTIDAAVTDQHYVQVNGRSVGRLFIAEKGSTPATPASGFGEFYPKSDGKPYFLNDAGTETDLTAGGSPTGAAGGDLSGTYPNPSVVNDSHDHTAATITGVIETGDAAGGDLSGTYPNPSVVDDSHNHTAATVSGTGGAHAHVVSEVHLSNGSGTTYTLDQAFEPGSVIAWNTTSIARLGVTETEPDQATVSAAGSSGDSIVFDYAATIL